MNTQVKTNLSGLIISNSKEGIFTIDKDGRILSWNNAISGMTGVPEDCAIGKAFFDILPVLKQRIKASDIVSDLGEIAFYVPDTAKMGFAEVKIVPIEDNHDAAAMILFHDITRFKKAEKDLIDHTERFELIATATNDAMWDFDIRSNTLWWGDGISKVFGYLADEVSDELEWWHKRVHPDDQERVLSNLKQHIAARTSYWDDEYRFKKKDGKYAIVYDRGYSIFNEAGEPMKVVGGMLDITERKLLEQGLRDSESKFKELIQNAPIAVVVHHQGKVILANPEAARTLEAKSPNDLIGKKVIDFLSNEEGLAGKRKFDVYAKDKQAKKVRDVFIKMTGKPVDVEVLAIPINYDGKKAVQVIFSDITEQKEAEQAVKNREEFYKNILENSFAGISIMDGHGNTIFEGISNENIHGYTGEELDGHNVFDYVHPEDKPIVEEQLAKIMEKPGTSAEVIARLKHKNGSWRIIKAYLVNLFHSKTINGILVNFQDITDQRMAEEALKDSEERLELAIGGADLGLWDFDIKSFKIVYNQKWAEILGYRFEELNQHSWEELIHPDDKNRANEEFYDHLEGKTQIYSCEYRMKSKSGEWKWILDKGKVMEKDAEGNPIRALGTHLDIDDRKKAEEALKQSEELFRQLFRNTPIGIVLLDEERTILQANKGFLNLFNYTHKDISGANIFKLFHLAPGNDETSYINNKIDKKESILLETERPDKNGNSIPVLINIVPVIVDDKLVRIFGIYVDMTERKAKEEELHQLTSKLMRSNTELEQFAYITSHNLRSPVANLKGLLDLYSSFDDSSREMIIDKISHSVFQLDNTLQDLIEVVSLKNSIKEQSVKVNFESLLQQVTNGLEAQVRDADIIIEADFSDAPEIIYPQSHLLSIFQNMITNSIKYRSPERQAKIQIRSSSVKGHVELSFKDNGIGIDLEKYRDKLFKMYQRLHDVADGKGLGLYIIKSQVELLGGSIHVVSEIDKGAEFIVSLKDKPE